jgi:TPR repeat protein
MSYRLVTPPRSWNLPLSVLACAALLASLSPVNTRSCGWWGDGEIDRDHDAIIIGANGRPATRKPADNQGPVYEAITLRANALRKRGGASPAEIARLYLAAAGGGFPPAQNSLGNLYEQGLGVEQSNPRAAYWYRRAAEPEEPRAQHSLGVMYLQGRGVPQDPAEGASWLQRSAGQGHAAACADLANLYWKGEGVPQNKTHALAWWLIAAGSGDGKSVGLSSEAKQQMREAEIAAAEEMARNWAGNAR